LKQTIAIVGGTGPEGMGLARRFAHAGANVRIGSRNLERARAAGRRIAESAPGGTVEGLGNPDAVSLADIVVLTVPPDAQVDTLESLRSSFKTGAILVDATVRLMDAENSAQIAAEHVPADVAVASAFHTLGAELLNHLEASIDSDVLICSDNTEAKAVVAELVRLLAGARPVDAGGLKNSRLIENMVQLLIALNRRNRVKHAGIRITGL
jgi:8-hydroxy-5-deazaflavin:NADPH oxidoreductase